MNLVLHDIHDPHLYQADSLSKRDPSKRSTELLTPEHYDFVLANPPFTGTVDSNDLEKDSKLFPRAANKGKKKEDALTNKSELLFLWLMLDLLRVGGRCAVIIPEGVLFGNTDAHVRLRRELLTEHVVEGVISLPGGVFQPYTGVKTSILVFRKETRRDDKQTFTGGVVPRTEYVWFYEVEEDGYSDNAKRNPLPGQQNDLWDALEKFKLWLRHGRDGAQRNEKTLLQPRYWSERWRQALLRDSADKLTSAGQAFSSLTDTSMWDGQVWSIHELFPELPSDPKEAESKVRQDVGAPLRSLVIHYFAAAAKSVLDQWQADQAMSQEQLLSQWQKAIKMPLQEFNRAAKDVYCFFEPEDASALVIWKDLTRSALADGLNYHKNAVMNPKTVPFANYAPPPDIVARIEVFAREVAKLDGFDVTLRSLAIDQRTGLKAAKHWVVPVRAWARNDEWQSDDGILLGSHDADGLVRPAFVQAMLAGSLYDEKGWLKDGLLDPDCIEARGWNLSAGQYKPFDFTQLKSDKSVAELIGELKATEQQIINGLDKLLAMVEGRE